MGDRGDGRIQLKSVRLACSALIAESSTFSGVALVSSAAASAAACMLPYVTLPSITYPLLCALPRESSARQGYGEKAKAAAVRGQLARAKGRAARGAHISGRVRPQQRRRERAVARAYDVQKTGSLLF